MSELRKRNYATILYEESVPNDFIEIITSWHVPALLSPYHDKDKNPHGENKKPHWHLMIMFDGLKTKEQAQNLFSLVNGVGCEVIESIRGYARYLCHLDNPEKHEYSTEDIIQFAGADYQTLCMLDTDKVKLIAEMQAFCDENDIFSYAELSDYAAIYHYSWYRALQLNCSMPMMFYLKSRQWEADKQYKRKDKYIDRQGGEQ